MKNVLYVFFVLLVPAFAWTESEQVSNAPGQISKYEWKGYAFEYPSVWKITLDNESEGRRNVQLSATDKWPMQILLSFASNTPAPDEKYLSSQGLAGASFCIPIALRFAGDLKDQAIAVSYSSVELANGPLPSAIVNVYPADGKSFFNLDCFLFAQAGSFYSGAIITRGVRGQVNEDLDIQMLTKQAYEIVRSIQGPK